MPKFLWDIKQNSVEWFAARLGIPTASDFHRIITPEGKPSKAETTEAYMNRLLFEWVSGVPYQENDYKSDFMQHGHDNEDGAAARFEFHTGLTTRKCGFVTNDAGTVGSSPDRIVWDAASAADEGYGEPWATVELKSPQGPAQIGYLLDKPSLVKKYRVQTQGQIWVCEFDHGFIHSDHTISPVILPIDRDEDYISLLAQRVTRFVDKMLEKRFILEREYGPFVRPTLGGKPTPEDCGEFGVSFEDLEQMWAAKQ